jgi:hypothetical protein
LNVDFAGVPLQLALLYWFSLNLQAVPVEGGSLAATVYVLFALVKLAAGVQGNDGFLIAPPESVTTNF